MAKSKKPRNNMGQAHGLWEVYYDNGNLAYRGLYVNSNYVGIWEDHYVNFETYNKQHYNLQGNLEGIGLDGLND